MQDNTATYYATRVYTKPGLALYDGLIMGVFARLIWRCDPQHFVDIYQRNVSGNHADIGVGTGYCLDRCRFPSRNPRLALIDVTPNCLEFTARRLARYAPKTYLHDASELVRIDGGPFDSVGLGGVLHCMPGDDMRDKCRLFDAIEPLLHAETVVFGYSLVADNMRSTLRSHLAHLTLNRLRIVNNVNDRIGELRRELRRRFSDYEVETRGPLAFFRAQGAVRIAQACEVAA